ncbi:T9SS type A sorting domain-containing protein [Aestuariivivens marinum]|uniref:T9SS type A sorting domain-containing protein n=1 Tax=Aestuariivivens marinum TaxID=2913555 RepID=UPI001F5802D5|nr:T9SS type A sorting domain-containing protein [Aestuariivivens marinum]
MKNITFLFWTAVIVLLLSPQNVVAQPEYQLDRTEGYLWEDPNWFLGYRTQYTYDDPGADFTNSLSELYKDSGWQLWEQRIRTYNDDNMLNTEIYQSYVNDIGLINYHKTEYEYDSSGYNTKVTRYTANNFGDWTKDWQDVLLYDNGLNTEVITYEWDDTWKEFKKIEKNYNSENWIIKQEDFNWEDTHWAVTPQSTTDYTYYPNGLLKDETKRNGGSLVNNARTEYLYDNDKLSLESHYAWNYPNGPWILLGDLQYSYQSNGQLKEVIDNEYGWFKIKTVYFWNTLGVSSNELVNGKAYPNPFTDVLNISLKVSIERQGTLYIFDIMGKELSKINLNHGVKTITIHNLDFLKGIYFIKVSSGAYNQTFKVIKQ